MIYDYPEDFLAHHGIKGMRWGVRKQPKRAELVMMRLSTPELCVE